MFPGGVWPEFFGGQLVEVEPLTASAGQQFGRRQQAKVLLVPVNGPFLEEAVRLERRAGVQLLDLFVQLIFFVVIDEEQQVEVLAPQFVAFSGFIRPPTAVSEVKFAEDIVEFLPGAAADAPGRVVHVELRLLLDLAVFGHVVCVSSILRNQVVD